MTSILPIIAVSELQRSAKEALKKVHDYAVIQKHGHDVAFVLSPQLGKILLQSGILEILKNKLAQEEAKKKGSASLGSQPDQSISPDLQQLDSAIGEVLRELSKH